VLSRSNDAAVCSLKCDASESMFGISAGHSEVSENESLDVMEKAVAALKTGGYRSHVGI